MLVFILLGEASDFEPIWAWASLLAANLSFSAQIAQSRLELTMTVHTGPTISSLLAVCGPIMAIFQFFGRIRKFRFEFIFVDKFHGFSIVFFLFRHNPARTNTNNHDRILPPSVGSRRAVARLLRGRFGRTGVRNKALLAAILLSHFRRLPRHGFASNEFVSSHAG